MLKAFLISLAICSGPPLPVELLVEGFFSGARYCFIADSRVSCHLNLPLPPFLSFHPEYLSGGLQWFQESLSNGARHRDVRERTRVVVYDA